MCSCTLSHLQSFLSLTPPYCPVTSLSPHAFRSHSPGWTNESTSIVLETSRRRLHVYCLLLRVVNVNGAQEVKTKKRGGEAVPGRKKDVDGMTCNCTYTRGKVRLGTNEKKAKRV